MDPEKPDWYTEHLGEILSTLPKRSLTAQRDTTRIQPLRPLPVTIELHPFDQPYWCEAPPDTKPERRMTRFQRWIVMFGILIISVPLLRIAIGLTAYWIDHRSRN